MHVAIIECGENSLFLKVWPVQQQLHSKEGRRDQCYTEKYKNVKTRTSSSLSSLVLKAATTYSAMKIISPTKQLFAHGLNNMESHYGRAGRLRLSSVICFCMPTGHGCKIALKWNNMSLKYV